MPLVTITIRAGFSGEEKREISEGIHRSLVEEAGIKDSDFNHRILELDQLHWHLPEGRSERFLCVEIKMFPGRAKELKQRLFKSITQSMEALGMCAADVFIVIDEPPIENWSVSAVARPMIG